MTKSSRWFSFSVAAFLTFVAINVISAVSTILAGEPRRAIPYISCFVLVWLVYILSRARDQAQTQYENVHDRCLELLQENIQLKFDLETTRLGIAPAHSKNTSHHEVH